MLCDNQDPSIDDDPQRAAYIQSIPGAQWLHGMLLHGGMVPLDLQQGLDDFEVRDDDIYIFTYPKSGTTWTEEMVSLISYEGNVNKVMERCISDRRGHLEVGRPTGHFEFLGNLDMPRLIGSHLPLRLIPKCIKQSKCKKIYVVRNPKDNAVSYYHHHRMSKYLGNYEGSWENFLELYLKGYLVYGSWFDHVLPYWKFSQEHEMLFISYEDLKLDLPKMILKIVTFLDRPLSPEALKTILNHCSFEQMKDNIMVNMEDLPDIFDMSLSKFMRKGIIGDWKNYFTEKQDKDFTEIYNKKMQNSGLDIIFDSENIDTRIDTDLAEKVKSLSTHPNSSQNNCDESSNDLQIKV